MKSMLFSLLYFSLFGSAFLLINGCNRPEESAAPEKPVSVLVSTTLLQQPSASTLRSRFSRIPQTGLLIRHGVKVYKITYRTPAPDGKLVEASGAFMVPDTAATFPLLSQQHGTLTNPNGAPSLYQSSSESWYYGTLMAAAGYAVAAPDYLGYGSAAGIPHPYQHAATLASASRDLLRAVKEFAAKEKISLSGQLFLTGYSEGGYATMALHKLLEGRHADEFAVTAVAAGAGAYHKSRFAREILTSQKPLEFINAYLWVLDTYNRFYGLNRPWSYYLNEPYASQVTKNGVHTAVSKDPRKLFTPAFREAMLNRTDKELMAALEDNDIYDWKPQAPLLLYHGTADDYVPYFNSEDAYRAMQARGAANITLRKIDGANHFTAVAPMALETFFHFAAYLETEPAPAGN